MEPLLTWQLCGVRLTNGKNSCSTTAVAANIVPLQMNMSFFPGPEEIACIAWNDGMFME